MRKVLYILLIICFLFIITFSVNGTTASFPLIGKTIILDSGHGGKDGGAIVENIKEKDLNLQITLKIKDELVNLGANVILTRSDDNDLSDLNATRRKKSDFDNRIKIINNSHADLYLSIHLNSYENTKYRGPQVFYTKTPKQNKAIAEVYQEHLNKFSNSKRKVKINTGKYMYEKLNVPGVLIECGFLTNYFDRTNLQNTKYQQSLATVIGEATIYYFYN